MKGRIGICYFLICLLLFFACDNTDNYKGDPNEIRYGVKQEVILPVDYSLSGTQTRAAVNETMIEDVNIYIINEFGDLVTWGYYSTAATPLQATIYSNMNYVLYAIANAGRELPAKNRTELEEMVYTISSIEELVSDNGAVLMAGKTSQQKLQDGQNITINLTRCISKVVLSADYSNLNSDVAIAVKSVAMKNVPKSVRLYGESKITAASDAIDGEVIDNPTAASLAAGLVFYAYENRQGTLLPGNIDQKQKVWPDGSLYSKTCSYIELEAEYSSPRKRGNILYRFYLGADMVSNFDMIRNTQHNLLINFNGDGAVEENTWRVDNTDIVDLVTCISLSPSEYTLTELGETVIISATVQPVTAQNKTLSWSSSDTGVATVDVTGKVSAVGDGNCTITAASTDGTGITAVCDITVDTKVYVTGIVVTPETLSLFKGEQGTLTVTITPDDATNKDIVWSSSNTDVAMVDDTGKVTAVAEGEAVITATAADDNTRKATCSVTVTDKEFSINPAAKTLYAGESFLISYVVKPPATPVFESLAPAIATVDDTGKVTAVSAGETKIKVSAHGMELFCNVTVVTPKIEFPASGRVMYNGESVTVPYSALVPGDAQVNLTTSNGNATVTATAGGIVINAITPGSCRITASIGSVSATYDLDIQQLRIVPKKSSFTLFNHFDYAVEYDIYPEHAACLGAEVILETGVSSYVTFPDGADKTTLRISLDDDASLPSPSQNFSLTLQVKGRDDASANVPFNIDRVYVKPEIKVVANLKEDMVKPIDMGLRAPAKAREQFSHDYIEANNFGYRWEGSKPKSLDWVINWLSGSGTISKVSTADNGQFTLKLAYKGDDGKIITLTSAIILYDAVYCVGIAQMPEGFTASEGQPGKWNFQSEVFGRWYTSPESPFMRNLSVAAREIDNNDIILTYKYDNEEYISPITGKRHYVNGVSYIPGGLLLELESGYSRTFNVPGDELYVYKSVPVEPAVNNEDGRYGMIELSTSGSVTRDVYVYTIFVTNFGSEPFFSENPDFDWRSVYYRTFGYK